MIFCPYYQSFIISKKTVIEMVSTQVWERVKTSYSLIADHGQVLPQTASPSLHHLAHPGHGKLLHLAHPGDGELLLPHLAHLGGGGGMAKQALPAFFRFSSSCNSFNQSLNSIQLKPNAAPPQGLRFRVSRDDREVNPMDYYWHRRCSYTTYDL